MDQEARLGSVSLPWLHSWQEMKGRAIVNVLRLVGRTARDASLVLGGDSE